MKKSYLWRKMTSGLMAAAVTVTAMPGLGLTMVQAEEKKTLKVAMECSYAPYNWTQPDDSNGAVPISGSSDYAYGYDVMMAKKICDELGYDLEIVKLDWDSLVPAVQSGKGGPAIWSYPASDSRRYPHPRHPVAAALRGGKKERGRFKFPLLFCFEL